MLIEILTPDSNSEWDNYVEQHPDSTCYHLRNWKRVALSAYQIETPFLLARETNGGKVCGALPLFLIRGRLQGHATNGLFGAYGSVLADHDGIRNALIRRSKELLESEGLNYLMLKLLKDTHFPPELELQSKDLWVIAKLTLDSDPQKIWWGLKDKTRNCVRRAMKYRLEVRAGKDQLKHFYDVLAENMHSKGSPIYGLPFMKSLVDAMSDRAEIITLWDKKKVVSGALLIDHRDTTYVPFASSRPNSLHMSPNNLLYWEIIHRGCMQDRKYLDFGRSLKGSGTLMFKQSWGAKVYPQTTYVSNSREKKSELKLRDRKIDWFVRQWKRLPRPVADALGPALCRKLAGLI